MWYNASKSQTEMPMATTETKAKKLLDAVRQMTPDEFDAFIDQALSVRARPRAATLSAEETKLLSRINSGLPAQLSKRHDQLAARRKKGTLSAQEHQEPLML